MATDAAEALIWEVTRNDRLRARLAAAADDDAKVAVAVEFRFDVTRDDLNSIRVSLPWGDEVDDEDLTRGRPAPPWSMPPEHWRDARLEPLL